MVWNSQLPNFKNGLMLNSKEKVTVGGSVFEGSKTV